MSREAVELMVGRAVVDREFCARLLAQPHVAAEEYELNEFERRMLRSIRASSLADFAGNLERLLDQARPVRRARAASHFPKRRATA